MTNKMNNHNKKRTVGLAVLAGLAVVLGTAGCNGSAKQQNGENISHGEEFVPEGTPRSVDKFVNAQAASGARADATLNPCHFDGNQLNSLGREKLRAMLKDDDACDPMTVYVNAAGENKARREAVTSFLTEEGLSESQIRLKDGPNPGSTFPATKGMKAFAISDGEGAAVISAGTPAPASPTTGVPTK
jgi:hypothetical protein